MMDNKINRKRRSNFYYTFLFLNKKQQHAIKTIYRFCRLSDDIVDSNDDLRIKRDQLDSWSDQLEKCLSGYKTDCFFEQLKLVIDQHYIPHEYFKEIILGMEMDLNQNSYKTFADLELYCYRVASVVGLISIYIFGSPDEKTKMYAISLGKALQLTNIIRDAYNDSLNNRFYIPEEDFIHYKYTSEELKNGLINDSFHKLMLFQYQRAFHIYQDSQHIFSEIMSKNLRVAQMMGSIYYQLLKKIKRQKFNVFEAEIKLNNFQKIKAITSQFYKLNFL